MIKKGILIAIVIGAAFSLGWLLCCGSSSEKIMEVSGSLAIERVKVDAGLDEIARLAGEMEQLRKDREVKIKDEVDRAIKQVDAVSGDRDAFIDLWRRRVGEFRDSLGAGGNGPD